MLQALAEAEEAELVGIDGIADISASAIRQWFSVQSNSQLARELAAAWEVDQPAEAHAGPSGKGATAAPSDASSWSLDLGAFTLGPGQKIMLTGKLGETTRPMIERWCGTTCGARALQRVTAPTTCTPRYKPPAGSMWCMC